MSPAHSEPYHPEPWPSFDGTRFPYSVWLPKAGVKPRAVVILVPGWDGTMTDYSVLAEHLARAGYAVYGSEQRTGVYDPVHTRRGNPSKWHDWVADLQGFTNFVAVKHPRLPIVYHAHSFGTLVATQAGIEAGEAHWPHAPRGLVLQSMAMPFLIEKESALKGAAFGAVAWVRFGHLAFIEGSGRLPTGDAQQNCQWLRSPDRLAAGYKVRYLIQAAMLGHQVRLGAKHLRLPVLALEGEQDSVVAPTKAEKWDYDQFVRYELCAGRAEVIRYRDGYHTMTIARTGNPALDETSAKALRDITRWLARQRNSPTR